MTSFYDYSVVGMYGHALGSLFPFVEWHIRNSYMPHPILLPPPSLRRMFCCGVIGSIGLVSVYATLQ